MKMKTNRKANWKRIASSLFVSMGMLLTLTHCGDDETTGSYTQVERLGRPAINEGLVITNSYINAFNSIPPSLDLSDSASAVLAEAGVVLDKIIAFGLSNALTPASKAAVVGGFLPDVMRIDTDASISVNQWAYNGSFTTLDDVDGNPVILTGGRKLEDDVIDITLTYLFAGNDVLTCADQGGAGQDTSCTIKDNVNYHGDGGSPANPAQGHQNLNGQSGYGLTATFPYLALPN